MSDEVVEEKRTFDINSAESFAHQVQGLLLQCNNLLKGLNKKDLFKLLEYSIKFPFEHDALIPKLQSPRQLEVCDFINRVSTAKQNAILKYIEEHGAQLQAEAAKRAEETTNIKEECKCDGKCEDCGCEEEK